MIHQHIFASPKPGMSELDFQRYWLDVHAVRFASKIRQIKRYKVDLRVNWKGEVASPPWNGLAEIWLENEKEQLQSLQSPEFLEGARLDEPKWAAFWNTLVLDTDSQEVFGKGQSPDLSHKLIVLSKRKAGMSVADYRKHMLESLSGLKSITNTVERCMQCFVRDAWYEGGETRFDGVTHLWFPDLTSLDEIKEIPACRDYVIPGAPGFVETRYIFKMAVKEHWVIGPDARS